jgi:ParB-like chromosome segregation protein Spo0J
MSQKSNDRFTFPMKIEQLPTADLIPYARNSRTHSPEQTAQIAGSIREFGFTNPVLIDADNGIIAGHGRVLAAQKLGLAKVPCIRLSHLTDTQKRAYIIADNKLALNAGWDEELLALELTELQLLGIDPESLGFSDLEIDDMLNSEEILDEVEKEIEHEQSLQVEPAMEYLIILAKDLDEWDEMIDFFKLEKVRRGGYKKGSAFDAIGLERVLKFERVKNAYSDTK